MSRVVYWVLHRQYGVLSTQNCFIITFQLPSRERRRMDGWMYVVCEVYYSFHKVVVSQTLWIEEKLSKMIWRMKQTASYMTSRWVRWLVNINKYFIRILRTKCNWISIFYCFSNLLSFFLIHFGYNCSTIIIFHSLKLNWVDDSEMAVLFDQIFHTRLEI